MTATNNHRAAWLCRVAIAFVWVYHGLVPKLLGPHEDELAMNLALGISPNQAMHMAYAAGVAEVFLGTLVVALPRWRWPLWLTIALMAMLLAYACVTVPELLSAAFNPVTINVTVAVLAFVALLLESDTPPSLPEPSNRTKPS